MGEVEGVHVQGRRGALCVDKNDVYHDETEATYARFKEDMELNFKDHENGMEHDVSLRWVVMYSNPRHLAPNPLVIKENVPMTIFSWCEIEDGVRRIFIRGFEYGDLEKDHGIQCYVDVPMDISVIKD